MQFKLFFFCYSIFFLAKFSKNAYGLFVEKFRAKREIKILIWWETAAKLPDNLERVELKWLMIVYGYDILCPGVASTQHGIKEELSNLMDL